MSTGDTFIEGRADNSKSDLLQHIIKILLIEDNPGDARLIRELLRIDENFKHELTWVSSISGIEKSYKTPDVILLDLNLPESLGLESFDIIRSIFPDTPIIVQTGLNDSLIGDETVAKGAQDYLVKGNFSSSLLIKALKYGIERNNLLTTLSNEKIIHERGKIISEIFENASVAIYRTTRDGEFLVVNSAMVKMFGYNSKEEFRKVNAKDLYPDPSFRKKFQSLLEEKKNITGFEEKLLRKDGTLFYTLESSKIVTDEKGNVYYEGVIEDISKRKEAENALSESLKEKEVLLKELHHRTKNNMQVISSLITLKANHISDESVKIILKDICARIRAIALIHQKLYQSKNLSHINLKDYITELSELLMNSHNNNKGHVSLELDLEDIYVQIDNAIQCGLVINELITNSLKYAFPGKTNGEISIIMHNSSDNFISLKISDTGVGIPKDIDLENYDSLGIQLVKAITEEQLGGSVVFDLTNGFSTLLKIKNVLAK